MRKAVKNITMQFIIYMMIGTIVMLIANKAIFIHVHKLADGTIIIHAHPYNKSNDTKPYKSHHHSDIELLFFQNMEILFLMTFIAFALLSLAKQVKHIFHLAITYGPTCINLNKGRAPPIPS